MRSKELAEVFKTYYKWRAIGVIGIWISVGISAFSGSLNITTIACSFGLLATFFFLTIGVPEVSGDED